MDNEQSFISADETEGETVVKRHIKLFDDLKIDDVYEEFPDYDEEFFKPIELDKPLQKLLYNEADVMASLERLKDLVERKNRFNYALARAEQTIRYISGYLKDYDIEVKRKITREFIEFTVRINIYNGIVDRETELQEIKNSLRAMFPDADEELLEEAAKRIIDNVMKNL